MIRDRIIEMVKEELMIDDIDLDANLANDLQIDSIGLIEFIMSIEEEFDITIEDEELQTLASTNDVINLVETKVGE